MESIKSINQIINCTIDQLLARLVNVYIIHWQCQCQKVTTSYADDVLGLTTQKYGEISTQLEEIGGNWQLSSSSARRRMLTACRRAHTWKKQRLSIAKKTKKLCMKIIHNTLVNDRQLEMRSFNRFGTALNSRKSRLGPFNSVSKQF